MEAPSNRDLSAPKHPELCNCVSESTFSCCQRLHSVHIFRFRRFVRIRPQRSAITFHPAEAFDVLHETSKLDSERTIRVSPLHQFGPNDRSRGVLSMAETLRNTVSSLQLVSAKFSHNRPLLRVAQPYFPVSILVVPQSEFRLLAPRVQSN